MVSRCCCQKTEKAYSCQAAVYGSWVLGLGVSAGCRVNAGVAAEECAVRDSMVVEEAVGVVHWSLI